MTEVITYDFEEFECMQHQNIANHWYKTGQPRITIVMETPMYPILKLMGMKSIGLKPKIWKIIL